MEHPRITISNTVDWKSAHSWAIFREKLRPILRKTKIFELYFLGGQQQNIESLNNEYGDIINGGSPDYNQLDMIRVCLQTGYRVHGIVYSEAIWIWKMMINHKPMIKHDTNHEIHHDRLNSRVFTQTHIALFKWHSAVSSAARRT